jgi:hypothetical protein
MHKFASSANTSLAPSSHRPPEVVCVKVPRKLGIDVYDMHIAF